MRQALTLSAVLNILFLFHQSHAQSKKERPYMISLKGDTTFYIESERRGYFGHPNDKVRLVKAKGESEKVSIKEMKGFGGFVAKKYTKEPIFCHFLILPKKGKEDDKGVVYERLAQAGDYAIMYYIFERGGQNGGSKDWYHLYHKGKFVEEIEKDNYKTILADHFSSCTGEKGITEDIKFKQLDDWCYRFNKNCGQ